MTQQTKPDRTLNTVGLFCPEPVFRTKVEMDALQVGKVLEVLADDPASKEDITTWVKRAGQELIEVAKDDRGVLRFLIRKVK